MRNTEMMPSSETELRGGSLANPAMTDMLMDEVCSHQGPGCGIIWKICEPVPRVPLRRRLWVDKATRDDGSGEIDMQKVLALALTPDQNFAQTSEALGISVSILHVVTIDLVNSYWYGKIGLDLEFPPVLFAHTHQQSMSQATHKALLTAAQSSGSDYARRQVSDLLRQDVADYAAGKFFRYEFQPIPGMSDAECLMRYLRVGVLNWCRREDSSEAWPVFSGDAALQWDGDSNCLKARFTIESQWFAQPSLRHFPFDTNEMCAVLWVKGWPAVCIKAGKPDYGLGDSFQEVDVFDFRGDSKVIDGWTPYICESNVVPNSARSEELIVYGRFWVRRKVTYFMTTVILPTAVLTLLGVAAILVASDDSATNIIVENSESPLSFAAGLILTMMAMKFTYMDSLPKLGYLTMLDWYVTISFLFLAISATLITLLESKELKDMHASIIYTSSFAVFNVGFFGYAWYVYRIPVETTSLYTFADEGSPKQASISTSTYQEATPLMNQKAT